MLSAARHIVQTLRAHGHEAYFAGGCVRDMLRGVPPKDVDIATSATPDQVQALFADVRLVGAHFGVALVRLDSHSVEVATFRSEGPYSDGRHPDTVRFTTAREDVHRRDFTINGLLYDPLEDRVLDFVGGRADLAARRLRAIGDPARRFQEDALRLLRAVRFAGTLSFEIEPATWSAVCGQAEGLTRTSMERIRDEFLRLLTEPHPEAGCRLLHESGLACYFIPEMSHMDGVPQPPEFHPEGDVWTHTLLMLAQMAVPATPSLALGVLLHDIGKPDTYTVAERIRFDGHVERGMELAEEICARLRCAREVTDRVVALVRHHLRFKDVPHMKATTLKRFLRMDHFDEHLELHRLDCRGSHGMLQNWDLCRGHLSELSEQDLRPPRLLTGHDLIAAGYQPGPVFTEILRAVEDAQLEGRLTDRDQALAFVRDRFPRPAGPPP